MADHAKLQILKRLTAHLSGITHNNQYETELKGVYRGRDLFGRDTKRPFVSLLEGKASDYGQFANDDQTVRLDSFLVLVQGVVDPDDKDHPTDAAYNVLADVESRLSDIIATDSQGRPQYPGVYHLGGLITGVTIASSVVRPADGTISDGPFFYLPILLTMATNLTNPKGG